MKKIHELKILIDYAEMVHRGVKTFELRKNDRDFHVGDLIRFRVVDYYTLPMVEFEKTLFEITCVVNYPDALKDSYVCLGIRKYSNAGLQS
jgi:DNA-directed RNA polymerase subunit E'/Rpb7